MGRSTSLTAIAFVALVTLTGCALDSPQGLSTRPSDAARAKALEFQVDALQQIVSDPPVETEPKGDASDGTYLGRITRIDSGEATATFIVDFASDAFMPWQTAEDAKRSSWPAFYGWNRYAHTQRCPLGDGAVLFVTHPDLKSGQGLVALSAKEYLRRWDGSPSPDAVQFIQVADGQIAMVRPWCP